MNAAEGNPTPAFKRCPRCNYSLRGLPATHACPECGLRFDDHCERYPVTNLKRSLLVYGACMMGGAGPALENLPHAGDFPSMSIWDQIGVLAGLIWVACAVFLAIAIRRTYCEGMSVAITRDGLICRLWDVKVDLVPWQDIDVVSIKDREPEKAQVACVSFKKRRRKLSIGGLHNVFPTRADVERFVEQVNERVETAQRGA